MLAIAFLAQNCALGLGAGTFSPALVTLQTDLHTSRAVAASALGLMYMSLGLMSPFVGGLLQHISIRTSCIMGALLSASGYVALAYAPSFLFVAVAYALLIGPGACLMSVIPASTLVTRWFERDRGKALGIVNIPIFLLLIPPVAAQLLLIGGRQMLFLSAAALYAGLLVLLWGIIDRPEDIGQTPRRHMPGELKATGPIPERRPTIPLSALLSDHRFWLLSLVAGCITGSGAVFVTHAVSIATGRGIDFTTAATFVSMFGAGSIVGGLLFGWLADRIGAFPALVINTGMQVVLWLSFLAAFSLPSMIILSLLVGMCAGSGIVLHSAALNDLFGPENFSRAMGFSYGLKVPFLFAPAPIAGYLFDISSNYNSTFVMAAAAMAFATALVVYLSIGAWRGNTPRSQEQFS